MATIDCWGLSQNLLGPSVPRFWLNSACNTFNRSFFYFIAVGLSFGEQLFSAFYSNPAKHATQKHLMPSSIWRAKHTTKHKVPKPTYRQAHTSITVPTTVTPYGQHPTKPNAHTESRNNKQNTHQSAGIHQNTTGISQSAEAWDRWLFSWYPLAGTSCKVEAGEFSTTGVESTNSIC